MTKRLIEEWLPMADPLLAGFTTAFHKCFQVPQGDPLIVDRTQQLCAPDLHPWLAARWPKRMPRLQHASACGYDC